MKKPTHTSYIELSRSAVQNNLQYLNNHIGSECKISFVVKGNAYGHGIDDYIPIAQEFGADHFSTFDAEEALEVHNSCTKDATIMIMGMIDNEQLEWAVEKEIEFFVFDMDRLLAAVEASRKIGKKAGIHIELETGMNRTGFPKESLPELQKVMKRNAKYLSFKGICTHYAGAEHISNFLRVDDQYKRFKQGVETLREAGLEPEKLHTACSAASIRLPHTRMDMVRIGILQFGFWPSPETYITTIKPSRNHEDPLKRVISWKSSVMGIKNINQGEYIGYGTSFMAAHDMTAAAIPVGYGHGFSRSLSNQGRVLIRGNRVPVVGMVNMNVMMIDVTDIGVEKGDEVVLIGNQGDMTLSVSSFSTFSDQLNYESLTRLPDSIPRYIVN